MMLGRFTRFHGGGDLYMKMRGLMLLLAVASLTVRPPSTLAQSSGAPSSSPSAALPSTPQPSLTYTRPTATIKFHNYLFDAFGPYKIVGAALAAGINQADNTPPDWGQGA